jgi:putative ABC transport system ATP-binding protein
MGHRLDSFPHQLSGGEMQRVAIARAVIARPRVILADEPTGNLDSLLGREVLNLLSGLHREDGFTIVVATHSEMPRAFATRELYLRDGHIAKESS